MAESELQARARQLAQRLDELKLAHELYFQGIERVPPNEDREKYKKDPQRMNQEIMKLYKEKKVNPLGGCLPMLLQFPFFIAT